MNYYPLQAHSNNLPLAGHLDDVEEDQRCSIVSVSSHRVAQDYGLHDRRSHCTWVRHMGPYGMQVSIGCTAVFLIGGPTKHTEPLPIIVLSTTPLHSTPLAEYCRTAKPPDFDCLFFSLSVSEPMSIVVFLAARRRRRHHGGRSAPLLERYSSLNIESQPCGMPSGSPLLGNGANCSYSCAIEPYCRAYD